MPFNPKFTITPKINNALVEMSAFAGFLMPSNSRTTGLQKQEAMIFEDKK